jgi:hypothetical protein
MTTRATPHAHTGGELSLLHPPSSNVKPRHHVTTHLLAQVAEACELHEAAKLHDARHLAAVHTAELRIATLLLLALLLLLLLRGRRKACTAANTNPQRAGNSHQMSKQAEAQTPS